MDNNYINPFDNHDKKEQTASPLNSFNDQLKVPTGQSFYSPMGGFDAKPPKKEKNKYPLSVLIACCVICSLLAGIVASGTMIMADKFAVGTEMGQQSEQQSDNKNNTVINIEKPSNELISVIAQKVSPSVVGIRATASVNSFFGFSQQSSDEGSGIIYKSNGYIITNYHVISIVAEATNKSNAAIQVFLPSDPQTAISASIVGFDSESDLAVIKIEKTGLPAVEIGDSEKIEVGETAVAIGNPGGLRYMGSVSSGVISGLNRTLKLEGTAQIELIQTDAAINPGNSGGALVNAKGQLIGVNSAKIAGEEYEGMGFAIPSNYTVKVCDNIINNKDVKRAYVGVKISTEYTGEVLQKMGYPAGALVESVVEGSPADKIGIRTMDIITEFDGVKVTDYSQYNSERLKHKPGESVQLKVYRSGRYYDVTITLGESNN
ncbi:MAG: trypsin-like peptidase domain-containing protein [Clostridia bacterium]|nr:trypsin-like peptidase domain-containing protein [Clostridia bacterium]